MLNSNFVDLVLLLLFTLAFGIEVRVKRLASPSYEAAIANDLSKYVVSIRSRSPRNNFGDNHFCSGAIVTPRFVLTAAVCVMNPNKIVHRARVLMVVAGSPNRLKMSKSTVHVPVGQIFVHENYTIFNTNNIALLLLSHSLPTESRRIAFMQLPTEAPTFGIDYRVVGWGRMYKGGILSALLLHIDVKLQTRADCLKMVYPFSYEMLCAGNINNLGVDESPCLGDAGDPLMINHTVYGIATYSLGCGHSELPSIYTDVWHHLKWIKQILKENTTARHKCPVLFLFSLIHILRWILS